MKVLGITPEDLVELTILKPQPFLPKKTQRELEMEGKFYHGKWLWFICERTCRRIQPF